jgi:hypothetical protein
MMLMFAKLGIPASVVTPLSAWKEALALGIGGFLLLRSSLIAVSVARIRVTFTDLCMAAFGIWVVMRLLLANLTGGQLTFTTQLYGIRFYLVPVCLYLIGRLAPLSHVETIKLLHALAIVGGITSVIALVEWGLPDSILFSLLEFLGYFTYYNDLIQANGMWGFGGTSASMWIMVGDTFLRRVGSVYFVSKAYAFNFLLMVPIIIGFVFSKQNTLGTAIKLQWGKVLLIISAIGLFLTFTRASITTAMLVALGMFIQFKKQKVLFAYLGVGISLGLILFTNASVQLYVSRILSGEESSSSQHLQGWTNGIGNSAGRLWIGSGVGTANQDALRFGAVLDESVAESIYVQAFQELGLVGILLYLLIFASLIANSRAKMRHAGRSIFSLGLVMYWTTLGVVLISLFAIPWQGAFVITFFYWFLCGQLNGMRPQMLQSPA